MIVDFGNICISFCVTNLYVIGQAEIHMFDKGGLSLQFTELGLSMHTIFHFSFFIFPFSQMGFLRLMSFLQDMKHQNSGMPISELCTLDLRDGSN